MVYCYVAPFNILAAAFSRPWPPLLFRLAHSIAHHPLKYSVRRIQSPIPPFNILAGAFTHPWPPSLSRLPHSIGHHPLKYSGWRILSPIAPFNISAATFSRPWTPLLLRLAHSIASSSFKGATKRVLSIQYALVEFIFLGSFLLVPRPLTYLSTLYVSTIVLLILAPT